MKNNGLAFALILGLGLVFIAGALSIIFANFIDLSGAAVESSAVGQLPVQPVNVSMTPNAGQPALLYNPPRPEDAPEEIRAAVILGHNIVMNTQEYAGEYVGNDLNCTHCHFNGGISMGGKNGGLSLVGVAAVYPQYRPRQDYAVDLVTRTNDCFTRSENGKPLPPDSKEMVAILAYYKWISAGVPIYNDVPWLGAPAVKSDQPANADAGSEVYATLCAACHGSEGQGTNIAPPVWGDGSYNDGAGMSKPNTLAAFTYLNMPRGNSMLTPQQALDVATFVNSQPRPHYP